ncbi:AAA family ATPase [Caulobacter sp. NIBR1757]|uniref:AAA family ATPase n=1 Tax=Caulobacter sp. NIBR1757 TaxID=3016000 RepID=UPI0022F0AADB|nr:AAA family ATPase [Caulobacter sp. NIBR1757]WGM38000.1 Trifunctional NAD biosynthesis/regulator protein NadR [Caulobacter sp. NIBR1757]
MTAPFGRPQRGFLLGKFMPPHAGHQYLCDFARAYCEHLTILVCSLDREPIPGHLRAAWMRELYPDCRVVHFSEDVPQEPQDHPDFWDIWRGISKDAHPEPVDVVFASEPYGARLAEELGARFVPVDPGRETQAISGTAVRAAPFRHWSMLPAPVRAWYTPRICLFGPESTGKTTLARRLADHFATVVAPEYGRTYTEVFGTEVNAEDLIHIAAGHQAGVAAAARAANRLLICDTDPVLTAVWSRMLVGRPLPQLEAFDDLCDLYLLTDIDAPWVDDGTRYFPQDDTRRRFFDLCRAELDRRGARYITLSGGWNDRFETAVAAIHERWPDL